VSDYPDYTRPIDIIAQTYSPIYSNVPKLLSGKTIHAYPIAKPAQIPSGTAVWEYGNWTEIMPANTIKTDFSVLGICIYVNPSMWPIAIQVGTGAAGEEKPDLIDGLMFGNSVRTYGSIHTDIFFMPTPVDVPANSRISARIADNSDTPYTSQVKVLFQEK